MPNHPNILLITSDQQHWNTLGIHNPRIRTPALDRLAGAGVNSTRAYCPNPTCTPTRASIITGLYPSTHGAYTLGTALPHDVPTVGDHLREAGYRSTLVGKAHFEPLRSPLGERYAEAYPTLRDLDYWRSFNDTRTPWYGFDHVELARNHADEGHVGQHYAIWMQEQGLTDWLAYFRNRHDDVPDDPISATKAPPMKDGPGYGWRDNMSWQLPEQYHYTCWTGLRTIAAIEQSCAQHKPFFIWSSYHDPHPPYCVSEPWASMYNPDDMEIGRFVEGEFARMPPPHQMTRQRSADWKQFVGADGFGNHGYHTHAGVSDADLRRAVACYYGMISFMDHWIGQTLDALQRLGQLENTLVVFTSDHGHFLGQHGLVAKGPFHYEDVIRVPFIASMPGTLPQGVESGAIQSLVDLAPTFLQAAGLKTPTNMQGLGQMQAWSQAKSQRDHAIVENHHQLGSQVHLKTLVTDHYKLTVYRGRPWGELFDLEADPGEMHNRFDDPEYREIRARLMEKLVDADLEREWTGSPRVWMA